MGLWVNVEVAITEESLLQEPTAAMQRGRMMLKLQFSKQLCVFIFPDHMTVLAPQERVMKMTRVCFRDDTSVQCVF